MSNSAQEAYLTQRVLSADPVELIRMLHRGAAEAVETARARLAARDIQGRSAAISKAMGILAELAGTLDHRRAPELSRKLASLYDYMQRRLIDGNLQQTDAPLAEVQGLIGTLAEGWQGVSTASPNADLTPGTPTPESSWTVWSAVTSPVEPALHGWSF